MAEQGHLGHKAHMKSQKNIFNGLHIDQITSYWPMAGARITYPLSLIYSLFIYPLSSSELGRGTEKKVAVTKVRASFQVEVIRQCTRASNRHRHLTALKFRDEL